MQLKLLTNKKRGDIIKTSLTILCVLLAAILCLGLIANMGAGTASGSSSDSTAATTSGTGTGGSSIPAAKDDTPLALDNGVTYYSSSGSIPNASSAVFISSYNNGISTPEGAITMGYIANKAEDAIMIGYGFYNLTVGQKYAIEFSLTDEFLEMFDLNVLRVRLTPGTSEFVEFFPLKYEIGWITFTATAESCELWLMKLSPAPTSEVLQTYCNFIAENSQISLRNIYEVVA